MKRGLIDMTTVAAYISKEENRVYMACDSQASNSSFKEFRKDLKIIRVPDDNPRILIGFAGSILAIQTIAAAPISPPNKTGFINVFKYVQQELKPFLEPLEETKDFYFEMLIAFDGNIYMVQSNYTVSMLENNYNAIGTGRDYALGALYALGKNNFFSAKDKLIIAVEAAINNDLGSGGNINVEYV